MNSIDKIISFISPKAGFERAKLRAKTAAMKRSYDGATKTRRSDGWGGHGTQNQNIDIGRSLTDLRNRSIEGYKNNSTVFKAIRTIQNNVIGTGIMPTPVARIGDRALTKTELKKIKS
mgnify:FL=1